MNIDRADRCLVVNPRLVVWPGEAVDLFLLAADGRPCERFELPPEAISALARFAEPQGPDALSLGPEARQTVDECLREGLLEPCDATTDPPPETERWAGFRLSDMAATTPVLSITRSIEIGGRRAQVLDDLLEPSWIAGMERWFFQLAFRRVDSDTPETLEARHWISPFDPPGPIAKAVPLFARLERVAALATGRELRLARLNAYSTQYGDLPLPHRDLEGSEGITLVCYGNAQWQPEAMAETVFMDDGGDAIALVSPRPGRVVLFDSAILHRAGAPARLCLESRFTLVMKFLVQS